ncbi:MAG: cupredoxin family protein [Roseivivax sp.]|nr:cupredoxin family protein [Roseivivax sp.]
MTLIQLTAAALIATAGAALADGGHAHADDWEIGRPGDAHHVTRTIEVDMLEPEAGGMAFSPAELQIAQGETVRFVITNRGALDHEMVFDTMEANMEHMQVMMKHPDMHHSDPNAITLAPGESGELIWTFSQPGTFQFACLIPGHMEAGMQGPLTVN